MVMVTKGGRFADELRRWRTSRRWSQLELALRAGTTQRHLSYAMEGAYRTTPTRPSPRCATTSARRDGNCSSNSRP